MTDQSEIQRKLKKIIVQLASLEETLDGEDLQQAKSLLLAKKAALEAELTGSGAIAQGEGAKAVGANAMLVDGDIRADRDVIMGAQTTNNFYGTPPLEALPIDEATRKYLDYLISHHQYLRLQGIRAGSHPLSVALEKVYVSLSILDQGHATAGQPGKRRSPDAEDFHAEAGDSSVASVMQRYRRLVIIGDPGSGKTTLLAYLTLTYARDYREASGTVRKRLGLDEAGHLPIQLPLRDLGSHLREKKVSVGKEGASLLLDYLREYYLAQNIALPGDFFDTALEDGKVALFLDGMDEVADVQTRQRVARLIECFAARYPKVRFVVTSREVGYDGAARVGAEFGLAKVRDFSPEEVRQFIRDWTRVVEITLAQGSAAPRSLDQAEVKAVLAAADAQSQKLSESIDHNARVAELAVNPLLLTVIALVHRYRAKLPERRSELYEEAVEVLLGHWDSAKGLEDELDVAGIGMDSGDRRSFLEPVAFWMHERNRREIELYDLKALLLPRFRNITPDEVRAEKAVEAFLRVIQERSGLMIARGIGVYGFAHLTFQEYLAARALAGREDALAYTLTVLPNPWWREVILLQAGYISSQSISRVSGLIRAMMNTDRKTEPEPHHHLLLAAECLFDVGNARVEGDLLGLARQKLQTQADAPLKKGDKPALLSKLAAMNALARIESGRIASTFWKAPLGEPEWITIPEGEFWMGSKTGDSNEKPVHRLFLPEYRISRVPVTNAQYAIYVQDAKASPPSHWRGGDVPKGLENHPVVNVNWHDAMAYCHWLGGKINQPVSLPSEAEWEKAARGGSPLPMGEEPGVRAYPWGNDWKELHCNSNELGLGETTPVGLFLNGASPYGLLDMSGNVWEWTRSIYGRWDSKKSTHVDECKYPYTASDGREDVTKSDEFSRVLRGGAFSYSVGHVRCASRDWYYPDHRNRYRGFRVVVGVVFSRASL